MNVSERRQRSLDEATIADCARLLAELLPGGKSKTKGCRCPYPDNLCRVHRSEALVLWTGGDPVEKREIWFRTHMHGLSTDMPGVLRVKADWLGGGELDGTIYASTNEMLEWVPWVRDACLNGPRDFLEPLHRSLDQDYWTTSAWMVCLRVYYPDFYEEKMRENQAV